MRPLLSHAVSLLLCVTAAGCGPAAPPATTPTAAQALTAADAGPPPGQDGSYRFVRNGWTYVHLEGSHDRIGYQHGYLLADEIEDMLRVLAPALQIETERDWQFYRSAAEKVFWPNMDADLQAEIDGIVRGLGAKGKKADRWDVLALQGIMELPYYYVPWLEAQEGSAKKSTQAPGSCSAFMATGSYTKDGGIVMGHSMWTDYVTGSRWTIIFDIVPPKGHRILMDGLPGSISSSSDFGVNDAGLMITETTITGFELFDPTGKPGFYRARKALQYASTIDEFIAIMLDGNNGGYANGWMIGERKTGEIAYFEIGLKLHQTTRKKDGYFVGANFPVDPEITTKETSFDVNNKGNSPNARRARWEELMAESRGKIDVELAKKLESDSYDTVDDKEGPSERTLCGAVDASPRGLDEWGWGPYYPGGTVTAKVMDSKMAERMELVATAGHPCGTDFIVADFLKQRPEYEKLRPLLRDMKSQPWTPFSIGMK